MPEDPLVGKTVWMAMDRERSGVWFSDRKGIIVRVIDKWPRKKAALVEPCPHPRVLLPFRRRIGHLLLAYRNDDEDGLERTFEIGLSVAEVFRLKRRKAVGKSTLQEGDFARLGIAVVNPWPKLSTEELRGRLSAKKLQS